MTLLSTSALGEADSTPRYLFDANSCVRGEESFNGKLGSLTIRVLGREEEACLFKVTVEADGSSTERLCAVQEGPVGVSSRGPDRGACATTKSGGIVAEQRRGVQPLVELGPTVNGKREGVWTSYLDQEPLPWKWETVEYRNGLRDGKYLCFVGPAQEHGRYRKGKKEGHWVEEAPGSSPWPMRDVEGEYANGLRVGTWVGHDYDGVVRESTIYRAGKRHGPFVSYYADGTKFEAGSYEDDLESGQWRRWYEDGSLRDELSYRRGRMNGRHRHWFADGRIGEDTMYVNGLSVTGGANKDTGTELTSKSRYPDGPS